MAGSGTVTVNIIGNADRLHSVLNGVNQKVAAFGQQLVSTGKMMTYAFTVPIVGGAVLSAKAFGDFEQQLHTFQAVTGTTAEQMEKVDALAIKLGADVKLPGTSALDAAEALTELTKSGLTVEQAMAAVRPVLQLSAAAQIENARAAEIAANALNAFHLDASQTVRIVDLLAATANSSSVEIEHVADSYQMASSVFNMAKFTIEDLSAAIAIMGNNGIKGSDAGTSLKQMVLQLMTPTAKAAGLMNELGIEIYNTDGSMKSFREIIDEVSTATENLTAEQRDAAFGVIFGSDAVRAANIVLAQGTEEFDKMTGAVTKQGAAQDVAEAKTKGFKGTLEALKSQVETLAISVGEIIVIFANKLIPIVSAVANWFTNLDSTTQTVIIGVLALVAAIGPFLIVVGNVIKMVQLLQVTMAFLAANPIVLVIAAIAALVAGLVIAYHKFEGFRNVVDAVFDVIQTIVSGAVSFIRNHWELILAILTGPFGLAVGIIINNFDKIKGAVGGAISWMRDRIGDLIDAITSIPRLVSNAVNSIPGAGVVKGALGAIFHAGGVVPGPRGQNRLIMAQGGERILPMGSAGTGGGPIHIQLVVDSRVLGEVSAASLRDLQARGGNIGIEAA